MDISEIGLKGDLILTNRIAVCDYMINYTVFSNIFFLFISLRRENSFINLIKRKLSIKTHTNKWKRNMVGSSASLPVISKSPTFKQYNMLLW